MTDQMFQLVVLPVIKLVVIDVLFPILLGVVIITGSLSIPIVTLCAMILLIIMVALFDMFFRWIPYLFVAIPVPGLRAKAETKP